MIGLHIAVHCWTPKAGVGGVESFSRVQCWLSAIDLPASVGRSPRLIIWTQDFGMRADRPLKKWRLKQIKTRPELGGMRLVHDHVCSPNHLPQDSFVYLLGGCLCRCGCIWGSFFLVVRKNSWKCVDLWEKLNMCNAIYGDMTQMEVIFENYICVWVCVYCLCVWRLYKVLKFFWNLLI